MPTCNNEIHDRFDFLYEAVNSIIAQDYKNWELIIKDGGTHPALMYEAIPADDRILYIHGKDSGITEAINTAFALAHGDIYHWFNDDDIMAPGTLSYVVEQIEGYDWLYGRTLLTTDPIHPNRGESKMWGEAWDYTKLKTQYNFVPQAASFWTEKAAWMVGPFDDSEDLTSDYDYWIRLGKDYTPKVVDRVLAYYRIHPDQITQKINAEQSRQAELTRRKHSEV